MRNEGEIVLFGLGSRSVGSGFARKRQIVTMCGLQKTTQALEKPRQRLLARENCQV